MLPAMPERSPTAAAVAARVYGRPWRAAAALLVVVSRASLPLLLVLVVVATDPPIDLPALLELLIVLTLVPGLAATLMRRAAAARVELGDAALVLRRADLVVEVPTSAIAHVAPWALPLPAPGVTLWMRSGARLRYVIESDDPAPLLSALAPHVAAAHAAAAHPTVAYARAAAAAPAWRWQHYLGKFVLFALAPTLVFFNAHQHIAYGGTLGEYYLFGAAAYARTFAVYWLTLVIYLVLFAGLWRGAAEIAALLCAHVAPAQAVRVRHIAERGCQILYYGGVPALVAARFLG
jgi:apolipoprotein N-acyltransferase